MAHQNVLKLVLLVDFIVDEENCSTGITPDKLDAFRMQGMDEHLGTNHFRSGFGRNWGGISLGG